MFCRTVMQHEIAPPLFFFALSLIALIANERAAKSDAKAHFAIWRSKVGFHLTNRTSWHAKCVADGLDGGRRACFMLAVSVLCSERYHYEQGSCKFVQTLCAMLHGNAA